RHAELICRYRGERIGIMELRKHALWYTKGLRGAAQIRGRFSTMKDLNELNALAQYLAEADIP
ncbi:MAG: tRNA dihydrouridine synthase DusB, partial [Clostridia bacterium]|nr:tRNA dihydrouridine synthase DusB [Clostridia bacterium]